MEKLFYLTEDDRQILRRLKEIYLQKPQHEDRSPGDDGKGQWLSPEVYIVKTPEEGVPARVDDEAGEATCELYYLKQEEEDGPFILTPVLSKDDTPATKDVFNIFLSAIPGEEYITVKRDKRGRWLVESSGVSLRTGVLAADLNAGSSATVNEITLDGSDKVYTGRSDTVYDLKLNLAKSIPANTIIDYAPMNDGRMVWITAYCSESDTLPEEGP